MRTTTEPVAFSPDQQGLREPGGPGHHRLGGGAPERSEGPHPRERRGRAALRHGPHSRRAEDRLAHRPERPGHARLRLARAVPGAAAPTGDRRAHDGRLLRRQEQLVGGVRVLGVPAVRLHEREAARRRAGEVGAGGPADDDRRPDVSRATNYKAPERNDAKIRAFMDEVLRARDAKGKLVDVRSPDEFTGKKHAHARVSAGRRAARRAHPGREERSVGARREPGRHVQDGRRAARDLREGAGL